MTPCWAGQFNHFTILDNIWLFLIVIGPHGSAKKKVFETGYGPNGFREETDVVLTTTIFTSKYVLLLDEILIWRRLFNYLYPNQIWDHQEKSKMVIFFFFLTYKGRHDFTVYSITPFECSSKWQLWLKILVLNVLNVGFY